MTKEQFLNAVNDIDDKFIKEIIEINGIAEDPQKIELMDERPQMIYLKNERVPFRKFAVAAALVCVFAAGIFAAVKLSAPIRTTNSSANSSDPSGVESDPVSISITDPENNSNISESAAFTATIDQNDLSSGYNTFVSGPVRKSNSRGFAEVSFKCRGVSEENPLYISVCRKEGEKYHGVSDEIKVTGGESDKIVINYTETVGAGDELSLTIRAENGEIFAAGLWNP